MTMRTNKQERTAYNLTILAESVEPVTYCGLYAIAEDNKLACIDGKDFGLTQYVFVPAEEWQEAAERDRSCEKVGRTANFRTMTVSRWYYRAKRYMYENN